jgi:hypothetical protein
MQLPEPPPHFRRPPPQVHAPPVHTCPIAVQSVPVPLPGDPSQSPAAPQWVASVAGTTQAPLQLIWPEGHETTHEEPLQTLPVNAQLVPALAPMQVVEAPQ